MMLKPPSLFGNPPALAVAMDVQGATITVLGRVVGVDSVRASHFGGGKQTTEATRTLI